MPIPVPTNQGLLLRLAAQNQVTYPTIGGLSWAASRSIREGKSLILRGEYHGSLYLAGYGAEMILGYSYAKACSIPEQLNARDAVVQPARRRAEQLFGNAFVSRFYRQGHSPLFWWKLLKWQRSANSRPIPHQLESTFDPLVDYLQDSWDVWLRYLPPMVTAKEAGDFLAVVEHLVRSSHKFWR